LLGWLGMIGWVTKAGRAQNGNQAEVLDSGQPPAVQLAPSLASSTRSQSSLSAAGPRRDGKEATASVGTPKFTPPPPLDPEHSGPEPPPGTTEGDGRSESGSPTPRPWDAAVSEDPEAAAREFLEANRKEAESRLRALTSEAEQLRARLDRLNAGISRWQSLLDALSRSQQESPPARAHGGDAGGGQPIPAAAEVRSARVVSPSMAVRSPQQQSSR